MKKVLGKKVSVVQETQVQEEEESSEDEPLVEPIVEEVGDQEVAKGDTTEASLSDEEYGDLGRVLTQEPEEPEAEPTPRASANDMDDSTPPTPTAGFSIYFEEVATPENTRIASRSKQVIHMKAAKTGMTPKKFVLKEYTKLQDSKDCGTLKAGLQQDVLDRRTACVGFPIHGQSRGTCPLCKRETQWYCIGCRIHCCLLDTKEGATEIKSLTFIVPAAAGSGEDKETVMKDTTIEGVKNTCYLHLHWDALQQQFGKEESRRVSF